MEIEPAVTHVGLRLVDLNMKKIDLLHGDAAKELGMPWKIFWPANYTSKSRRRWRRSTPKLPSIAISCSFRRRKLRTLGWDKVQALIRRNVGRKWRREIAPRVISRRSLLAAILLGYFLGHSWRNPPRHANNLGGTANHCCRRASGVVRPFGTNPKRRSYGGHRRNFVVDAALDGPACR